MSNYEKACNYISGIPKFAPKTELENTRILLKALGNPQDKYKSLHVAGTNGKGSVCRMLSLMLQKAGYKTGLFISPHLIRMNERISINGTDISDEDFLREFEVIRNNSDILLNKVSVKMNSENNPERAGNAEGMDGAGVSEFAHPAYFEFLFAMAADYFARQGCDFVVWETGLGGRLDATNTVTPEVAVITSIGMDHMQYLGNTITEIAGEKAGIIKPGIPVVYNTGSEEADRVIEAKARELGSRAIRVPDASETLNVETAVLSEETEGIIEEFANHQKALYQADNARTAAVTLNELFLALGRSDIGKCLKEGLDDFTWPGRMEEIESGFVVDGAHNEDAVIRFVESAKALMDKDGYEKLSLIFAVCEDKDYESIVRTLCLNLQLEDVYVAELNTARKTPAATVVSLFQKYRPVGEYWKNKGFPDLETALRTARKERDSRTVLMAVGSLYLVGEILNIVETTH